MNGSAFERVHRQVRRLLHSCAMSTITTEDGTEIYYKDWGQGPAVTFSHGWPLSSDMWDGQMLFLANKGFMSLPLESWLDRPWPPR